MKSGFVLFVIFVASAFSGCATAPVQLANSDRLIARPDFQTAARAAPEWCSEALKTINRLEHELERK